MLSGAFGAAVDLTPPSGPMVRVHGVFREQPVIVQAADGRDELIAVPTLRLPRSAAGISPRWTVAPAVCTPRRFIVLRVLPPTSPAPDALLTCELEEIG